MDHLRSGVQDQPGQHNKTPSLLKVEKLARHDGVHQLLGRLRQENHLNPGDGVCGEPRLCHCTPAWATRVKLRLKKKIKRKRNTVILLDTDYVESGQEEGKSQVCWLIPVIPTLGGRGG